MSPHTIKRLFPNASASLLAANAHDYAPAHEHPAHDPSPCPKPQQAVRHEPLGPEARKESHPGRVSVRVTSYRRRLLDPDNLCPKYFVDACRYAGFIRDDTAAEIEFTVGQVKVKAKGDEKTTIEIVTPDTQKADPG